MIGALAAAACTPTSSEPSPAQLAPPPAPAAVARSFTRAQRCGECHEAIHQTWSSSPHAAATSSELFRAMRSDARQPCMQCHAPIAELARDGVTCEGCHRLAGARPDRRGGELTLTPRGNTEVGTLCDPAPVYFHRAKCEPLLADAAVCGACHLWSLTRNGVEIPVLTEYAEWEAGPYASMPCQSCHMDGEQGELATGAGIRTRVPDHGLFGVGGDLRARAITLDVEVDERDDVVRVRTAVTNANAGHAVPSGLAGRQLVVRVTVDDARGARRGSDERIYARVLVDGAGREVPFYRAVAVASDHRIAPEAVARDAFELPRARRGSVRVEVLWRPLSPVVAAALGTAEPVASVLATKKVALR